MESFLKKPFQAVQNIGGLRPPRLYSAAVHGTWSSSSLYPERLFLTRIPLLTGSTPEHAADAIIQFRLNLALNSTTSQHQFCFLERDAAGPNHVVPAPNGAPNFIPDLNVLQPDETAPATEFIGGIKSQNISQVTDQMVCYLGEYGSDESVAEAAIGSDDVQFPPPQKLLPIPQQGWTAVHNHAHIGCHVITAGAGANYNGNNETLSDGRNYAVGYEKQSNVANHGNQQTMEINRFSLRNPLNNMRFFNFTRILTLTASTSVHDILAFVIPTLLTFVQMKYPNENLFKTRPVTMNIVLYTLLAYSLAFGVRHRFLNPYPWFHMALLLFGSASLASLLSLVFPNYYSSWLPMLCVLGVLLLFGWLLLGLARNLWRGIQAQIGQRQGRIFSRALRARRRRVRMARPLLPLTLPDQLVGPFVVTPMNAQ